MLRNLAWQATDNLTRAQLSMYLDAGQAVGLSHADRGRALGLDRESWAAWMDFMEDGPLPAEPQLPEMLRRLGETTFSLAAAAE